jgi:16S rRNA (guanine527-N7)-methyltransferase
VNPVLTYFPLLTPHQADQISQLEDLYRYWNERINIISRKDIDNLAINHILHSLAIARLVTFNHGALVLDAGTGGGLPGIPLAILFPDTQFLLADSIGKKIMVVENIAAELGLKNVTAKKCRVEELNENFDYVVSRAVTSFPEFHKWVYPLIKAGQAGSLANGIFYLKGGELSEELKNFTPIVKTYDISLWFEEAFFETKKVIYLPVF